MTAQATASAPPAAAALEPASARAALADPPWLADARAAALRRFAEGGLPSRVDHLWRYTDPARILPGTRPVLVPDARFGELPPDFHDATWERAAGLGASRDGVLLRSAVDPFVGDVGVVVEDIRAAARSRRKVVEPRLFSLRGVGDAGGAWFDDLAGAVFAGGVYVRVPMGVHVERPVRIASRVGGEGLLASRSLIVLDAGAHASVVVDLTSADDAQATLYHETTEVFVGRGARLRLVSVQSLGSRAVHAPVVRARVEQGGSLETVTVALGGALVKSLQAVELAETGATSKALGIVFADGRQHLDHHTFQDHAAPSTTSDLDYRAVAAGRGRSAFTGRLRIRADADRSDAHQRNHNLLLSDDARADTIPELEILTNDVACSHAAAVAPIDEEQVHFCESRGLSPDEARRVIVLGFLEPALARIPGESLSARIREALETRLARSGS